MTAATQLAQATMPKPKKNIATQLFLLFERNGAMKSRDVIKFNTKPELDQWLKEHDVTPISIIRGKEKLFKVKISF